MHYTLRKKKKDKKRNITYFLMCYNEDERASHFYGLHEHETDEPWH